MENYVIQEWEACFYCWETKAWKYGKLTLDSKSICFNFDNETGQSIVVDLHEITGFKRRLVYLIYRAVVVSTADGKTLWFSSLNNREEVFYFLEHFWKERLLYFKGHGKERKEAAIGHDCATASTSCRVEKQRVFELLYNSEETLINVADTVFTQGEQLDQSSRTMNKMHHDLNTTETLLNGLDIWFGKWDIKSDDFYEIKTKKEYHVLYRKSTKESYYPGLLVLSESQMTVLSSKRVADISILLKDLTNIVVNTPWHIVLVSSAIGELDVIIDITSAQVVYIIKALQKQHGEKFNYEETALQEARRTIKPFGMSEVVAQSINWQADYDKNYTELDTEDLETVSEVVGKLKSMAVGINKEMRRQNDSLDQFSDSVDKANHRVTKCNRKVQEKL